MVGYYLFPVQPEGIGTPIYYEVKKCGILDVSRAEYTALFTVVDMKSAENVIALLIERDSLKEEIGQLRSRI